MRAPLSCPQPIFKSPRNILTWLDSTLSYLRNFSQPASVLIAQQIRPFSTRALHRHPPPGRSAIFGPATIGAASPVTYPQRCNLRGHPTHQITITWDNVTSSNHVSRHLLRLFHRNDPPTGLLLVLRSLPSGTRPSRHDFPLISF